MSTKRGTETSTLRTGITISALIVACIVIAMTLPGLLDRLNKKRYILDVPVHLGLNGLLPGAEVVYGGIQWGQVESISHLARKEGGILLQEVVIEMDPEFRIFDDMRLIPTAPLVGSGTYLEIIDIAPERESVLVEPDEHLQSSPPRDGLTILVGMEMKRSIDEIAEAISLIQMSEQEAGLMTDAIDELEAEFSLLKQSLQFDIDLWKTRAMTFKSSGEHFVDMVGQEVIPNFNRLRDEFGALRTRASDSMAMVKDHSSLVTRNFNAITADLAAIQEPFTKEIAPSSRRLVENLQNGLEDGRRLQEIALSAMPDLRRQVDLVIAQSTMAGQQVAKTREELGSRLLSIIGNLMSSPNWEQVNEELLLQITREILQARADLEAANAAYESAIIDDSDLLRDNEQLRELLQLRLARSIARFDQVQARLLELITRDFQVNPTPGP